MTNPETPRPPALQRALDEIEYTIANRVLPTIYLAGPINGCTDAEAMAWRTEATASLAGAYRVLNPMRRDYRGREAENAAAIVEGDLADIRAADVILVNASRPSWGTAMELVYARQAGKWIVAFGTAAPSPWLAYHADVLVPTLTDAVREILGGAA